MEPRESLKWWSRNPTFHQFELYEVKMIVLDILYLQHMLKMKDIEKEKQLTEEELVELFTLDQKNSIELKLE